MILLSTVSGSVMAEWVKVDTTQLGTIYVDPSTIRATGNKVKMWDMIDLNTAGSFKTKYEYDCKEDKARMLAAYVFDGKMGEGSVVKSLVEIGKWMPNSPESAADAKSKIACSK